MNGTSKNVGLGKFWQDLEISEAFLISLEVSFLHGLFFTFFESRNFLPKSLGLGFLTRISASRRVSDFTIRHPYQLKQPKGADLKIFTSQDKIQKERSHKNLLRDNSRQARSQKFDGKHFSKAQEKGSRQSTASVILYF